MLNSNLLCIDNRQRCNLFYVFFELLSFVARGWQGDGVGSRLEVEPATVNVTFHELFCI